MKRTKKSGRKYKRRSIKLKGSTKKRGGGNNTAIKYPPDSIKEDISNVIYINLESRKDRRKQIETHLKIFKPEQIHREPGIENKEHPYFGGVTAHLNAMKHAKKMDWKNVLILEDDSIWNNLDNNIIDIAYNRFKALIKNPYDVIMLTGTFTESDATTFKVKKSRCASAYLVNKPYYDTIIAKTEEILKQYKPGITDPEGITLDVAVFEPLQTTGSWFIVSPSLMIQSKGYSDILHKNVDYTELFIGDKIKRIVYCFWTGTNEMSPKRKECLDFILANAKCEVVLVRPDNLDKYVLPDQPIHPAYKYLSETHKADYLRTYFMHFLGGGYTDIKKFEGDWNKAFDDMNAREDIFLNGYHEKSEDGVAGDERAKLLWKQLPANCAYIVRPKTEFTTKWYTRMVEVLDSKLDQLKKYPATNQQATPDNSPGYPIEWAEILGRIFHNLACDYLDKFLFTVPIPIAIDYR